MQLTRFVLFGMSSSHGPLRPPSVQFIFASQTSSRAGIPQKERKKAAHTHTHTHRLTLGHRRMASEVAAGAAGGPRLLPTSSRQRFAGCLNSSRQWPISSGPRLRQGLERASGCVGECVDMFGIFADKKERVQKRGKQRKTLKQS